MLRPIHSQPQLLLILLKTNQFEKRPQNYYIPFKKGYGNLL